MIGRFVDTNLFIRYLTGAPPFQAAAAREVFARIERGDERAWSTAVAIAEVVWVLTGPFYRFERAAIRDTLQPLLSLEGLVILEKAAISKALDTWPRIRIDYIDAYHAELALETGLPEVYSFDHDFDRIPGVVRIEPA